MGQELDVLGALWGSITLKDSTRAVDQRTNGVDPGLPPIGNQQSNVRVYHYIWENLN